MKINGTLIDSYNFGPIKNFYYGSLEGTYTPQESGMHTLWIRNHCTINPPSDDLFNYIDNITIKPNPLFLDVEDINIPCPTGGTADFKIKAGLAHGGQHYWMMMSVSGNYPGINASGINIPLNWDFLFQMGLAYPLFPGTTNFYGKLDFFGMASPTLTLPPDLQMAFVGVPIYFSLVFLGQGPSLPVTYASSPVHIKYVP